MANKLTVFSLPQKSLRFNSAFSESIALDRDYVSGCMWQRLITSWHLGKGTGGYPTSTPRSLFTVLPPFSSLFRFCFEQTWVWLNCWLGQSPHNLIVLESFCCQVGKPGKKELQMKSFLPQIDLWACILGISWLVIGGGGFSPLSGTLLRHVGLACVRKIAKQASKQHASIGFCF